MRGKRFGGLGNPGLRCRAMGDMADWVNQCNYDEEEYWEGREKRKIRCRYCGAGGFHWIAVGRDLHGKELWRLADGEGRIHRCNYDKKKSTVTKKTAVKKMTISAKVEMEVLDNAHCSKGCRFLETVFEWIESNRCGLFGVALRTQFDDSNSSIIRCDDCKKKRK